MDDRDENVKTISSLKAPWLSVVVPIYNAQKYLDCCVQSILKQSFRDFELLLIDDGSTDESSKICETYAAKDHRVLHFRKENTGVYHNRLFGLHRARGTYVTSLDADDFFLSNDAFETLYKKAQEAPCDLLQFGFKQVYRHLSRHGLVNVDDCIISGLDFRHKEYIKLFGLKVQGQHLFSFVHGKLFSRRLLDHLPKSDPPERLFFGEDVVLNLYLLQNCQSARFLPMRLYAYRETSGGTKRFSKTAMRDLDLVSNHKLQVMSGSSNLDVSRIEYRIFADIAGTLLAYTQSLVRYLSDDETTAILRESFALPSFQQARDYFLKNPQHNWTGVVLLRSGDPKAYMKEALQRNQKGRVRRSVHAFLKKVYSEI